MRRQSRVIVRLGSVVLGTKFIYRAKEILGPEYRGRIPPYEGQVLTVVGFRPRYVNQIVVQDPSGDESLMRVCDVEQALRLHPSAEERQRAAAIATLLGDAADQALTTRKPAKSNGVAVPADDHDKQGKGE